MTRAKIEIAPSILAADFRNLEREIKSAQDCGADRIHCDVMDGHFVPNISFGPIIVEAVKKCVSIPVDVHLMISEPQKYVTQFCDAGSDILTIHAEACSDLNAVLKQIRGCNVRAGVAVNPDKPIELFANYFDKIDQILIMTVYAGFGGQKFIPEMLDKIKNVAGLISTQNHHIDIQVDGGIIPETAAMCAKAGANVLVAGSFVFGAGDYRKSIDAIRDAAEKL